MDAVKLLLLAARLESKAGVCYQRLSLLAAQDGAVAQDLKILSKEEAVHANSLKSAKMYAVADPGLFKPGSLAPEDIINYIQLAEDLIRAAEEKTVNLAQGLKKIQALEILFEQAHLATLANVTDPSLRKLFQALSQGDKSHRERLNKILKVITPKERS